MSWVLACTDSCHISEIAAYVTDTCEQSYVIVPILIACKGATCGPGPMCDPGCNGGGAAMPGKVDSQELCGTGYRPWIIPRQVNCTCSLWGQKTCCSRLLTSEDRPCLPTVSVSRSVLPPPPPPPLPFSPSMCTHCACVPSFPVCSI